MSIVGGYSNLSAAGSRLKRCTLRPSDWAWVMMLLQNVDLPAPAGPVTRTASIQHDKGVSAGRFGREEVGSVGWHTAHCPRWEGPRSAHRPTHNRQAPGWRSMLKAVLTVSLF